MTKKVNIDIVAKDKTKRAIESSKKGLSGIKKFALAASAALATVGAGRIITNLVNVGKSMESLQVRFKFLFGSVEEGKIAFDNLSKFASKVPFALDDIAMASGNLAVVAKDAKDLTRILEITGNVAAFTGLDFQTTASQIQRAFSGGISAADIFREKGLRSILGFSEGAKVSIEETQKRFEEIFGKGGRLGNVTDDLANTFEGTLSMLQDKFLNFQMAVNESFFAELKKQFGDLDEALAKNEASIVKFGNNIGEDLATSLANAVIVINFFKESLELSARLLDRIGGNESFNKLIALATSQTKVFGAITQELINDLAGLASIFKELLVPQLEYHDAIVRMADGYGILEEAVQDGDKVVKEGNKNWKERMHLFDRHLTQQELFAQKQAEAIVMAQHGFNFEDKRARSQRARYEEEAKAEKDLADGKKSAFDQAQKLAAEGSQRSKKMFRLQQALNIGQAIMSTYTGAANALRDIPPPLNFAVAALTVATGLAQVANIRGQQPPAMFGGARQQGTPFLVGERGAELFTPATAGTITPNHQLGGGGATVNFNITTVDASSFGALLDTRRGQIVNMINTALNNKGEAALV